MHRSILCAGAIFVGYAPTSAPTLGGDMLQLRLKAICACYFYSTYLWVNSAQFDYVSFRACVDISDGTCLCASEGAGRAVPLN